MDKICSVDGCNRNVRYGGLCFRHLKQMKEYGKIIDIEPEQKICSVEGCNNKHCASGFCDKHYRQYKKYGHILNRTIYDSNEIVEYDDYAEIILYDKNGEETNRTLIDLDDIELVKCHKWYLGSNRYVTNNKVGMLHRFITNPPDNMVIDHINRNKLDNRKANLRVCTHQQNDWNKDIISTNTSGYTGVTKTQYNTWQATIEVNGRKIYLGSFKTKEEAILVRQQAEIDYYGDYRKQ